MQVLAANKLTVPQRERSSVLQLACRYIPEGDTVTLLWQIPICPFQTCQSLEPGCRLLYMQMLRYRSYKHQLRNVAAAAPHVLSSPPSIMSPTSPHRCCHRCPPHHPSGSSTLHQRQSLRLCQRYRDARAASQPGSLHVTSKEGTVTQPAVMRTVRHYASPQAYETFPLFLGSHTCGPIAGPLQYKPSMPLMLLGAHSRAPARAARQQPRRRRRPARTRPASGPAASRGPCARSPSRGR